MCSSASTSKALGPPPKISLCSSIVKHHTEECSHLANVICNSERARVSHPTEMRCDPTVPSRSLNSLRFASSLSKCDLLTLSSASLSWCIQRAPSRVPQFRDFLLAVADAAAAAMGQLEHIETQQPNSVPSKVPVRCCAIEKKALAKPSRLPRVCAYWWAIDGSSARARRNAQMQRSSATSRGCVPHRFGYPSGPIFDAYSVSANLGSASAQPRSHYNPKEHNAFL